MFYKHLLKRFGPGVRNLGRTDHPLHEFESDYKQISTGKYINSSFVSGTNVYLLENFKFSIAFENRQLKGYITEKMIEPLEAQCIPIYCGASDVESWINPDCFINVNNYPDWDSLCNDLEALLQDDTRLLTMLTVSCFTENFKNSTAATYLDGKGTFFRKCYDVLPTSLRNHMQTAKLFTQKIHAVTFADGKKYTTTRLQREMKTCGYFDSCTAVSNSELMDITSSDTYAFWQTQKSQRGFGWSAWKSLIVWKSLCAINDGDLLVWLDSGTHLAPGEGSRVFEYYSQLLESEQDLVSFRIPDKEVAYNKRDTLEEVVRRYPIDAQKKLDLDPYQYCTTFMIFKKTPATLEMLEQWHDISFANNLQYINNNVSVTGPERSEFVEHRYSQAIFSLLCKLGPCNVGVNNAVYDNNSPHCDLAVFQPRKWRK
jgi:hypothetical protein